LIASASDTDIRKETGLKSRLLGYGGALVLVVIALAILFDTFMGGAREPAPQGPAAAGRPQTSGTPEAPQQVLPPASASGEPAFSGPPVAPSRPEWGGGGRNGGTAGTPRCPAHSAGYQRLGDTITVTVKFPGSGYVAAFVEATGRESVTKSATNTGKPQTFVFPGVPENITRRVGVTVITGAGLQTCDVPAVN
jgi:hypothetical protein